MEATSPSRIAREFWRTLRGFPWKETGWRKRQGNDDWDILLNPRIVEDLWKLYFFGTILGKIWWCMSIVKGHFHIFSTRQVSDAWDETSLMQRFYLMKSFRILPCIVISTNDSCVYSWDWTEINVNLCFAHEFSAPHVTLLFCMYICMLCLFGYVWIKDSGSQWLLSPWTELYHLVFLKHLILFGGELLIDVKSKYSSQPFLPISPYLFIQKASSKKVPYVISLEGRSWKSFKSLWLNPGDFFQDSKLIVW